MEILQFERQLNVNYFKKRYTVGTRTIQKGLFSAVEYLWFGLVN